MAMERLTKGVEVEDEDKVEVAAETRSDSTINFTQIDQDGVRSLKEFPPGTKWVQMPLTSQPVEESSRLIDGV